MPRRYKIKVGDTPVVGFDYYISPTGSDSNDGSLGSPWAITALNTKIATYVGKRVGLLSGTYNVSSLMPTGASAWTEGAFQIAQAGTAGSPTIIESVTPREAIITTPEFNATQNNAGVIKITTAGDYTHIKGIKFTDLQHHAIRVNGSNILIEDCEFDRIGYNASGDNVGAISFGLSSFGDACTIRNCKFTRISNATAVGPDFSTGGTHNCAAIGPVYDYTNLVVEYCTFSNLRGPLYWKRNVGNLTFRYNFVENVANGVKDSCNRDVAALQDGGSPFSYTPAPNYIHNNIFARMGYMDDGGNEVGQWKAEDFYFYHNTVVTDGSRNGAGGNFIFRNDANSTDPLVPRPFDWRVYNNIFHQQSGDIGEWFYRTGNAYGWPDNTSVWDYNGYTYFKMTDAVAGQSWTTLAAWQSAKGLDTNSVYNVTPLFSNEYGTSATDFALQAGSPFKSAGKVGGVSGGASTDMGAFGGTIPLGRIGSDF